VEDKYRLPWTHEAIQSQSLFELLTRYWECYYEENKNEAHRTESGEVVYQTGDPLIDKWEQEIAAGLEPDLLEGLPSWQREAAMREQQAMMVKHLSDPGVSSIEEEMEGFSDDYTQRTG
jgi:hypothetical protein